MTQSLLIFPVRKNKDLVLLRQRSRQLAAMLGYERQDQATIAAGAFAIIHQAFRQHGACTVHFELADNVFRVFPVMGEPAARGNRLTRQVSPCGSRPDQHALLTGVCPPAAPLRLEKPLPVKEPPLAAPDLAFVAQELNRLSPPDVFSEIERQNQELLHILVELRACQTKLHELASRHANPSAA
jgi:hypothetical protein